MGSPSIIVTHRRSVLMAHRCTTCRQPILTEVKIIVEVQKYYEFSSAKAEDIANQTANEVIEFEISQIENCHRTKKRLTTKFREQKTLSLRHFYTTSVHGVCDSCPFCGCLEPWQSPSVNSPKISDLYEDDFPSVFRDVEKANAWVQEILAGNKVVAESYNERPQRVSWATKEALASYKRFKQWEEELSSMPELLERESTKRQLQECTQILNQLGVLDFKRKSSVRSRITALELKLEDIECTIIKKELPLKRNIMFERAVNLLRLQAFAFGLTGRILQAKDASSTAFYFEPNEIPPFLLESCTINNSSAQPEPRNAQENPAVAQYCRKCGFQLKAGSVFCSKCGEKTI